MMSVDIENPEMTYPKYTVGEYAWGGDSAECLLLHDSPPDQEDVEVALLDSFICTERGKVMRISRHQFKPLQLQEDL
jgi:hypothetical protein